MSAAADLATAEGLEGLSIARLAREVGMSKSGVAAHFASKETLQLAAVDLAAEGYRVQVFEAARGREPGLPRLHAMAMAWLDHIEHVGFRGGCFFAATGSEFGARPGPVRDRVVHHTRSLIDALEEEARLAVRLGELRDDVEPHRLVFQLHALAQEANLRRQLLDDPGAFDVARAAVVDLLDQARTRGDRS